MNMIDPIETRPDLAEARLDALFPTQVLSHVWPDSDDLNVSLISYAEEEMQRSESMCTTTTNVGGWHSPKSLGNSDNPVVQSLVRRFDSMAQEITVRTAPHLDRETVRAKVDMWCNINSTHNYNEPHIHRNCIWAGVYYAEVPPDHGDDARAGALEVFDPRPAALMVATPGIEFDLTRLFRPQAGLMVLFPSWLVHMVHPFPDLGRRISFAGNIQVHIDQK